MFKYAQIYNKQPIKPTTSVTDAATTVLDGFTVTGGNGNSSNYITVESLSFYLNFGGGMINSSSSPTITNCTFTGNSASAGGAMRNEVSASPTITNCTFTRNSATNNGGAMNSSASCSPIISNTTFTGNRATNLGGGVRNVDSCSPTITNCTFTGNSAGGGGGGISNESSSNPTIRNCILWDNGTEVANITSTPVVSYSIVQGGYTGCSNCPGTNGNADPLFVNAADPDGADNIHRTADDGIRQQAGSPAINAGNPAITTPTTDITGATRGAAPFDLGAYEGGVCPTLTAAAPPAIVSSQSACTGCALSGGVIAAPATACPTGSTLQYSTNGGTNWSTTLPTYHPTTAITVLTRCNCDTDTNTSSPTSSVTTVPGVCTPVTAGTGTATGCTTVTLTATGGSTYLWSGGSTPNQAINTFTTSGTYTVTVTGANGCTNTASAMVTLTPATLFVDQSISSSGNGATWATALKTLAEALTIAHNCSGVTTINVAAGTYIPTVTPLGNGISTVSFLLANGVAMYGGFPNGGGTRDIAANPTILSGDIQGDDVVVPGSGNFPSYIANQSNNVPYVVRSISDDATTVLDGFTVTGGYATGQVYPGGGMYNYSSSPTIANCTFIGNVSNFGGGMGNSNSSPTITNCTFTGNMALAPGNYGGDGRGGGMLNDDSSPIITNCTFTGNSSNYVGGGMANINSLPIITNCTFTGNSASFAGGGIANLDGSNPLIRNSIVWGNGTQIANNLTYLTGGGGATVIYSIVQGGYAGTGNLSTDPLFLNAANPAGPDGIHRTADDGLRLNLCLPGSPAINAGTATGAPSTDIIGTSRPQFAGIDIGAYESTIDYIVPPTAGISGSTTGCGSVTLTATGGNTYLWSGGSTPNQATNTFTTSGTYTVTVTDVCTASANATVTVTPSTNNTTTTSVCGSYTWPVNGQTYTTPGTYTHVSGCHTEILTITPNTPPVSISGNTTACTGGIISLIASPAGMASYQWSGPGGFTATTSAITRNATTGTGGTYSVTVTDAGGCTGTAAVSVTLTTATVSATITGAGAYCAGATISLTASGGTNYQWTTPDAQTLSGTTITRPNATTAMGGVYVVTVTNAAGCAATTSSTVTVPPPAVITGNTTYCVGDMLSLTASGGASYQWSGPFSFTGTTATISRSNLMTPMGGTYTVTVTGAGGCTSTASVVVTVNARPTGSISGSTGVCNGITISLTASGGVSYQWSGPGGFTASGATMQRTAVSGTTANGGTGGTYIVTVTNAAGCTNTASRSVTVNASPTVSLSGPTSVCIPASFTLSATGGGIYLWSGPNGFAATTASFTRTNSNATMSGAYNVTVTGMNGCKTTASRTVTVATCKDANEELPATTLMAYPNPSDGHTTVSFTTQTTQHMKLLVYAVDGREVAILFDEEANPQTEYNFELDLHHLPPGNYHAVLQQANGMSTQVRLVVVR